MRFELMAADTERSYDETRRDWESQYPTGRFSRPEEVAELTLFLCSARAGQRHRRQLRDRRRPDGAPAGALTRAAR